MLLHSTNENKKQNQKLQVRTEALWVLNVLQSHTGSDGRSVLLGATPWPTTSRSATATVWAPDVGRSSSRTLVFGVLRSFGVFGNCSTRVWLTLSAVPWWTLWPDTIWVTGVIFWLSARIRRVVFRSAAATAGLTTRSASAPTATWTANLITISSLIITFIIPLTLASWWRPLAFWAVQRVSRVVF